MVRNKTQQFQAEGRDSRQRVVGFLTEALTSPANPMDADQLREFTATGMYFPQLRLAIEKVDRSFSDTADLRKAILLAGVGSDPELADRVRWSSDIINYCRKRCGSSSHRPHRQRSSKETYPVYVKMRIDDRRLARFWRSAMLRTRWHRNTFWEGLRRTF